MPSVSNVSKDSRAGHSKAADVPTKKKIEAHVARLIEKDPEEFENLAVIIKPEFTTMHQITDHVFLTGKFGIHKENLEENKIKLIVNATRGHPHATGYQSVRVNVDDDRATSLWDFFDPIADRMHAVERDGGNIAVHCEAGVSRSSALVIAYLIKYKKWTLRRSYVTISKIREVSRPNSTFIQELIKYERKYIGTMSTQMEMLKVNQDSQERYVLVPHFLRTDLPKKFEEEMSTGREMNVLSPREVADFRSHEHQINEHFYHQVTKTQSLHKSPEVKRKGNRAHSTVPSTSPRSTISKSNSKEKQPPPKSYVHRIPSKKS